MNCKTETTHINQTFSLITNVLYSQSVVQHAFACMDEKFKNYNLRRCLSLLFFS